MNKAKVGNFEIGGGEKLTLLAGPCVLEAMALSAAVIVRSSKDSGRTMRCLFDFARAMILSISAMFANISH